MQQVRHDPINRARIRRYGIPRWLRRRDLAVRMGHRARFAADQVRPRCAEVRGQHFPPPVLSCVHHDGPCSFPAHGRVQGSGCQACPRHPDVFDSV